MPTCFKSTAKPIQSIADRLRVTELTQNALAGLFTDELTAQSRHSPLNDRASVVLSSSIHRSDWAS